MWHFICKTLLMKFIFLVLTLSIFSNIQFKELKASQNEVCNSAINKAEKKYKLPHKLLTAISLTETGRTVNGHFVSWPWSLNVSGKSFFFENKKNTKLFLQEKLRTNKKNIDVGCMQINYKYHNKNFKDLNSLLDPITNVEGAAKFLLNLHKKYKSWNIAISRYHSSDPERMKTYLKKVHLNWNYERQRKGITKGLRFSKKTDEMIEKKQKFKDSKFYIKNKLKIEQFREELMTIDLSKI